MTSPLEEENLFAQYLNLLLEGNKQKAETFLQNHPTHRINLLKRLELFHYSSKFWNKDNDPDLKQALISQTDPLLGKKVESYVLKRLLGKGASGRVYLAKQENLDRWVAVKFFHQLSLNGSPTEKRFLREGQMLAKLHHPNIIQVLSVGHHNEHGAYIAMQYVPGLPLSFFIELYQSKHNFPPSDIFLQEIRKQCDLPPLKKEDLLSTEISPFILFSAKLMKKMAKALIEPHRQNIFHRDIKPSNILLSKSGHPFLVDFGLAIDENQQRLTLAGEMFGTPLYMAPECLSKGNSAAGPRSDIYSLGVTFFVSV